HPEQSQAGDRFSGARFADDAERFPFRHLEADVLHDTGRTAGGRKCHLEIPHRNQRHHGFLPPRGSSASRRPSPRKFMLISMIAMSTAGAMSRTGCTEIASAPSDAKTPSDDAGGGTPSPRKLKNASPRMMEGIVSVAYTMIGPIVLGRRCRKMMPVSETPAQRAASTNCSCFRLRTWPRTMRA